MPGLQGLDWRTFRLLDLAKIAATAQDWCANTVQYHLVVPGFAALPVVPMRSGERHVGPM